jgi:ribosomal protein S18 acetylase RimI-like enzyme
MTKMAIRKATPFDGPGIAAVMETVAAERVYSAIDRPWDVSAQTRYIESLSARETLHVAVRGSSIVGFQVLDQWSAIDSMAHVGQVGTFLLREWRALGIGRELWTATEAFARTAAYRKIVIQVRASNAGAQEFYKRLGFEECRQLKQQILIDGVADDEILFEYFIRTS